jgi:hypothetical protein
MVIRKSGKYPFKPGVESIIDTVGQMKTLKKLSLVIFDNNQSEKIGRSGSNLEKGLERCITITSWRYSSRVAIHHTSAIG